MEGSLNVRSELVTTIFKKPKKKWIYAGAAVVIVLGAGIPILMHTLGRSAAISTSDIYQVGYGSVTQTVNTSGTVQSPTEISLNFQGGNGGLLKTMKVKVGDHVKAGQVLGQLDDASTKIQLAQAQAAVNQDEANLSNGLANDKMAVNKAQLALTQAAQTYQDQLNVFNDRTGANQQILTAQNTLTQDQQKANDTSTITIAQQQLSNAESNLTAAQQQLSIAQAGAGGVTSSVVQYAYLSYQNALSAYNSVLRATNPTVSATDNQAEINAKAYYDQVNGAYQAVQQAQQGYNQASLTVTQDAVALTNAQNTQAQAQQQIQTDEQNLQTATTQFDDRTSAQQSLDNAQHQVDSAKLNLQSAQATLSQDEANSPTGASLQSAQTQLASAQLAETNMTLKAPIDGVITQVNGIVGGLVSSSTPAVVIDDIQKSDLQVSLQLSESQIASVAAGQSILYSASAYPNKQYQGTITQVYPTPQVVSNVTQYTVMATIDNSSGDLKPGMTVSATIQTAQKTHVITVPPIGLHQVGNLEGVYVYGSPPQQSTSTGTGSGNGQGGSGNGTGNGTGSGTGSGSGSGKYRGGGSQGTTGGRSGGAGGSGSGGTGFGGNSSNSGYGGVSSSASSSATKLPSGVYFQPVRTGLIGSGSIEITRGLQAGEKILLVLPGQSSAQTSSKTGGSGLNLGAGGVRVGGGGTGGGRNG